MGGIETRLFKVEPPPFRGSSDTNTWKCIRLTVHAAVEVLEGSQIKVSSNERLGQSNICLRGLKIPFVGVVIPVSAVSR